RAFRPWLLAAAPPGLKTETTIPIRNPPQGAGLVMVIVRPYPWKCRVCRERAVNPVVVDYTAELEHDGRVYPVTVNGLEILRCEKCGAQQLPDAAQGRVFDALRHQAGLLTPAQITAGREALGL